MGKKGEALNDSDIANSSGEDLDKKLYWLSLGEKILENLIKTYGKPSLNEKDNTEEDERQKLLSDYAVSLIGAGRELESAKIIPETIKNRVREIESYVFGDDPEHGASLSWIKDKVRGMDSQCLQTILRAYTNNRQEGDSYMLEYLGNYLGFDKLHFGYLPAIVYKEKGHGNAHYGSYIRRGDQIVLYGDHGTIENIDTLAHEMWHAYQYQIAEDSQNIFDKGYEYKFNFDFYIEPEQDYYGYSHQCVEREARFFASSLVERILEERIPWPVHKNHKSL